MSHEITENEMDLETGRGRTRVSGLAAIAPLTTFFVILVWYGSLMSCFGTEAETGRYCEIASRGLGDGLGVILVTCMFMGVGLVVSTMLGGLISLLLGRMRQPLSRGGIIMVEVTVGLLVGAVPFFLVAFGSS